MTDTSTSLPAAPGRVVLFGSGETSASGSRIFQNLAVRLARPLRLAVLETPAGFEPNSAQVAGRVAEFLRARLQNEKPEVTVVPARRRGTPFSPDAPDVAAPLQAASLLFMGAGSPTYAVRQLRASLAWQTCLAAHRQGADLVLASAATLAVSALTLPVYEIYKVGEDPHWKPGLDLLAAYGLRLVFIPHWNNAEGGADLDTSHCFIGRERFDALRAQLPADLTVVGLDEHTALVIDLAAGQCEVQGAGGLTLLRGAERVEWASRAQFPLSVLGQAQVPARPAGVPEAVWNAVARARQAPAVDAQTPEAVQALVAERAAARLARDWPRADMVRGQLAALGWQVKDTPAGPVVERTG
ncbi:MAG: hypothetical protein KA764_04680 [Anaerolineales bacterium]|nr:hypothetical protein [Anaerolineales bacterium]